MIFDDDAYISSRPAKFQETAEMLRSSQAFQQFIEDRLHQLNSGTVPDDRFETALAAAVADGTIYGKKKSKVCLDSLFVLSSLN